MPYDANVMEIYSIRHKGLSRLIEKDDTRGLRQDLLNRVRNIVTALVIADAMTDFIDAAPPGWRVHQLSGDRQSQWSVSVSGNWRITFYEDGAGIRDLNLEDYH